MMNLLFWAPLLLFGHLFSTNGRVEQVGRLHYLTHTLYALSEPAVLKAVDFLTTNRFFVGTTIGRKIVWLVARLSILFPHGVVIPTQAAIHVLKDIEKHSEGEAHIAVGKCVCQWALDRYKEPVRKDITVWYGAEIYRRHFPENYDFISADEAAELLRGFHREGLVPMFDFCMQSTGWMFVLCNCDSEICCPMRVYNITGRTILPGPYIVKQRGNIKCLGPEECGACVERCRFGANVISDGRVELIEDKCMGCGLCVTTCKGHIRTMEKRPGYSGSLLPWDYVKDADVIAPA